MNRLGEQARVDAMYRRGRTSSMSVVAVAGIYVVILLLIGWSSQ